MCWGHCQLAACHNVQEGHLVVELCLTDTTSMALVGSHTCRLKAC